MTAYSLPVRNLPGLRNGELMHTGRALLLGEYAGENKSQRTRLLVKCGVSTKGCSNILKKYT